MNQSLQYRRTDKAIVRAFMDLCKQKGFEKITIKDILDEAPVSRNTFYAHYKDKYEIVDFLSKEFITSFNNYLDEAFNINKSQVFDLPDHQRIKAVQQKYKEFLSSQGDLSAVLLNIHTDEVDIMNYYEDFFYQRYLQHHHNQHPDSNRHLEAKIYASIELVLMRESLPDASDKFANPQDTNTAILYAALFAMGIQSLETRGEFLTLAQTYRNNLKPDKQ